MTGFQKLPGILIAAAVLLADQWTKWWAIQNLTEAGVGSFCQKVGHALSHPHPAPSAEIIVAKNFWRFTYRENPGAVWGVLSDAAPWLRVSVLGAIALIGLVLISRAYARAPRERTFLRGGLAVAWGGIAGNLFDRVRLGYVIDFIKWHWFDVTAWPTFNVADAACVIALGLLLCDGLVTRRVVRTLRSFGNLRA